MNSNYSPAKTAVNIKEVVWDLFSQWKAVLIAALLMALLVGGLKYAKDLNAYNEALNGAEAEKEAALSVEQRVEAVLDTLPEDERTTVEYLSIQEDWIQSEKEYISNSILMNTNPANQRTLILEYLISVSDTSDSKVMSLLTGYAGCLAGESVAENLRQVIAPEADTKYITELLKTNAGNNAVIEGNTQILNADENSAVMSVYIVLPDDADALAVEAAVTAALKDRSAELNSKIGSHSIALLQSEESYLFNADAVNNRNNVLYSIYDLTSNAKNTKTSLSDDQKAALDSIAAIKSAEMNSAELADNDAGGSVAAAPTKSGFNKKYALAGFVLGVLAYAFVYLLLTITRGCVNSASETNYYTQRRLLGEIYGKDNSKGFVWLLHSRFVEKIRYKGKDDESIQIGQIAEAIDAVCEHEKAKSLTFFDMTGGNDEHVGSITETIKNKGIEVAVTDVSSGFDEKSLIGLKDAVMITGPSTKTSVLTGLMMLCGDYDVRMLGCIYIDPKAMIA